MLNQKQTDRCISKLERFAISLSTQIFEKKTSLSCAAFATDKQFHEIPDVGYRPVSKGDVWGGESTYCWFTSQYIVPPELEGVPLYLWPKMGGYEAMLWVDGKARGTFATKIVVTGHGNHYCDRIAENPKAGQKIDLAVEFYSGHYVPGSHPYETAPKSDFLFKFESMDICVKNELYAEFFFDLAAVLSLHRALDDRSFRKGELENILTELHSVIHYSPVDYSREEYDGALRAGLKILKKALSGTNGGAASVPYCGIIGHSHMDTAWLWHVAETIKKCARTYSNQMNLMEQYPEYKFVQSSSCHSEMIREHYPALFEEIRQKVKEGRYEPNGGVWVECDCNITSGESMIRQFLWGQRFTREHFDYTSDCFWLPDTFGYSAAIPQIMKGCGVDYFLTTKIAWNDTNPFPYDTFYWQGLDGTKVFSHFNKTHITTMPHDIMPLFYDRGHGDVIRQKNVSKSKLVSFGFGDGGGGPEFEQIEIARRCADLEGCPKYEFTTVSDFMKRLEKEAVNPAVYAGELYLELHRGTLTNQHEIKRGNRLGEIALHNLEAITCAKAVESRTPAGDGAFRHHQNTLLINQFHDILPGTCIERANTEAKRELSALLADVTILTQKALAPEPDEGAVSVYNPSPFETRGAAYLPVPAGMILSGGYAQQRVSRIEGDALAVSGLSLAPYSARAFALEQGGAEGKSSFAYDAGKRTLETPFALVSFTEQGTIGSFYDKAAARELRGEGYPLNTMLIAEDVPMLYDNWDIDADIQLKFRDSAKLLSEELVSDGAVELRIRRKYALTEKSTLTQDMVFYAAVPEVRFETMMDWNDDHKLLKAAFDTNVFSDVVRQEIQFGHLKRPTTRNTTVEQAKFEVLNHKFTDLSEARFGVAILNDSKYAISAEGGALRLTLHKGGNRPDISGDHGMHYCEYSFLPHSGGFSAESVVAPAYEANYKPICVQGRTELASLACVSAPNVIVETVKPCEDAQNAVILRLYEAEGGLTHAKLTLGFEPAAVFETNMLEEEQREIRADKEISLTFRPFEIKTVKAVYGA